MARTCWAAMRSVSAAASRQMVEMNSQSGIRFPSGEAARAKNIGRGLVVSDNISVVLCATWSTGPIGP
ncbi:hypothetical protein Ade02nite_30560 [Paractinoplanes deccanensis]|uniref:Uncharacterized protein n=1 Tax=Paractinoplanes deccanensis TaxID=113561 RepID=A0ABQ3Y3G4_9ACTN|nr:hypothetical protein Ade02nite_30560 [Actinoplanes deccanensis]